MDLPLQLLGKAEEAPRRSIDTTRCVTPVSIQARSNTLSFLRGSRSTSASNLSDPLADPFQSGRSTGASSTVMAGTEPAAITGTVGHVVATFENGEALVKKIRENRAQIGAPLPPPALEQSLARGPRAIREAYETGWADYGEAFNVENDR